MSEHTAPPSEPRRRVPAPIGRVASVGTQPVMVGYGVLVVLIIIYAAVQPGVLSVLQLNIQVNTALTLILITAGQTLVMLTGELDLSVGGVVSLSTCLAAVLMPGSLGMFAVVVILAIAAAAGALNGLIIAYLGLPSFVVTLATWSIFNGLAFFVLSTPGGSIPTSYVTDLTQNVGSLSIAVYILLGGIVLWIWFRRTRLVTRFRAVGANREGAREAGVAVKRVTVAAFTLSSTLAAAGALFLVAELGDGDPTVGSSYVLSSVAAAVIGGTTLAGGRGDVFGAVSGGLIITLLGSVVFALGLPSYWQVIATGLLLLAAAGIHSLVVRVRRGGLEQ